MRKMGQIDVYTGFGSLTEILEWLKEDHVNRRVKYEGDKEVAVCFMSGETGERVLPRSNSETLALVDRWFDGDPEVTDLCDYFDENDNPLDDMFAEDYDMSKFTGEEWRGMNE